MTYKGATEWREGFAADLKEIGHVGVSPMRGKDYLRDLYRNKRLTKGTATGYFQYEGRSSIAEEEALALAYEEFPMSGEQGIFGRDTFDVRHCDVILANLAGAKTVSIGTVMEIQRGYDLDRYVCVVMEPGNVHDHPFVKRAASIMVPTLEQAFDVLAAMGAPYV